MRKTTIGVCLLLGISAVPLGGAHESSEYHEHCNPASDGAAIEGTEYYMRITYIGPLKRVELWKETNEISGLQLNSAMACGSSSDLLVFDQCLELRCERLGI